MHIHNTPMWHEMNIPNFLFLDIVGEKETVQTLCNNHTVEESTEFYCTSGVTYRCNNTVTKLSG
jgi:hypothetical protein